MVTTDRNLWRFYGNEPVDRLQVWVICCGSSGSYWLNCVKWGDGSGDNGGRCGIFVVFFNFIYFWINGDGGFVVDGYDSPKSRDATVLLDNQNDVVG